MKTLKSRYHHTHGTEEAPDVSLDRVLAHVLNIPLPPGQTLFRNIGFEHELSTQSALKKLNRGRPGGSGPKDPRKPIERALARIAKSRSAGSVVGVLDDGTVTSSSLSTVLGLTLVPFGRLEEYSLEQPGLSTARPRVLDLRKLHDVLMATQPETLRVLAQAKVSDRAPVDHHLLMADQVREEHTHDHAHEDRTPGEGDGPATESEEGRREMEVEKVAVPAFCTPKALDEVQVLNIESRIAWSEFLLGFPGEHRRNLWFVFSPESDEPESSPLLCPLGDKNLVKAVLSVTPEAKVGFVDGVTVNGLYNTWPHNAGRYGEATSAILRAEHTDAFKDIAPHAVTCIENGFLRERGYIDPDRVRELAGRPHSVQRYGNLLTRLHKVEQWLMNLHSAQRLDEGCSWSSWLDRVGYWPTYDRSGSST